jgi:hypothetical protein
MSTATRLSSLACVGLLFADVFSVRCNAQSPAQVQTRAASAAPTPTAEDREADKNNMLAIYSALKAYEKERGKLPDWLSDLVPKYLVDSNVLVSPFFVRTGQEVLYGNEDPHLKTSYIYEFSAKPVPKAIRTAFPNLPAGMTMKQWKTRQIAEFGPVVPIVRCFLHNPVLNVTSDGEFFESGAYWETDPNTMELRKKRAAAAATEPKHQHP